MSTRTTTPKVDGRLVVAGLKAGTKLGRFNSLLGMLLAVGRANQQSDFEDQTVDMLEVTLDRVQEKKHLSVEIVDLTERTA